MATLVTSPTLLQSAAAALNLNPTNSSVSRDAQEVYKIAVQNVRRKPRYRDLKQDSVDQITNAHTIQELAQIAGRDIARDRSVRAKAFWKPVGITLETISRIRSSFDLAAQAGEVLQESCSQIALTDSQGEVLYFQYMPVYA
jgi:hypothetical protein